MSKDNFVPKLDLAPKLKRPLSLWNPLDYLRLLYWVFYFPQALRWYVNTFDGGDHLRNQLNLQEKFGFLRQHPLQYKLFAQGLILSVITPLILSKLLEFIGLEIDWLGVGFGMIIGIALVVTSDLALGVIESLVLGISLGLVNISETSITAMVLSIAVSSSVGFSAGLSASSGIVVRVSSASIIAILIGVVLGGIYDAIHGIVVIVTFAIFFIRPDSWLINTLVNLLSINHRNHRNLLLPRVTLLPLPQFTNRLINWLVKDWEIGLDNLNQLLQYSLQFVPVVSAVNQVLDKTPSEQVIFYVTQLAQNPYDWNLLRFASASLETKLKLEVIETLVNFPFFFFIPQNWKQRVKDKFIADIRLDTPSRACAAGFWYLHEKQLDKAIEAFAVVRNLLYGEEVFILAQTLAIFQEAKTVNKIASLSILSFPKENILRPTTWQVMNSLRQVVEDIKLVQYSASRNTKSFAYNRAIGELTTVVINNQTNILESERALIEVALAEVIDNKSNIPEAERELIIDIALNWKLALERIGKEIGNVTITQPVRNPYVIGNPVTGSLFVGREDILRQLEELWITGNQLQSVVLYGHRRMGKSSILVNMASCTGAEVKVIYINLQRLGAVSQGVAEVLMAISDEIATAFNISSPDDDAFLKLPQRTFERYLKQVIGNMPYRGLIIALDEFETIEELIQRGQIEPTFMGFLRGLVQMNPEKIAFAFAGLHTLEEMTADYFQPFFASVIPIRVSFLSKGATKNILANPIADKFFEQSNSVHQSPLNPPILGDFISPQNEHDYPIMENFQPITPQAWGAGGAKISSFLTEIEANQNSDNNEFLLDYTGEALDLIYSLTSGQPYLTQLIGFLLVRNYNNQVFEQGNPQDNIFTVKDIEAVIHIFNQFFQQGRYYFEGVWGQAAQGVTGQQAIIKALAPYPQGLNLDNLVSATGLDTTTLEAAIATLIRHDVIQENNQNYSIIVELFRRWVLNFI